MTSDSGPAWADPSRNPVMLQQQQHTTVSEHEQALFAPYSTLNEPVRETILRDVRAVVEKLKVVMQPLDRSSWMNTYYAAVSTTSSSTNATQDDHDEDHEADGAHASNEAAAAAAAAGDEDNTTSPSTENNNNMSSSQHTPLSAEQQDMLAKLKDWDLWGPLVLCLTLAVALSFKAPTHQASLVFASVFTSVWIGSTIVTLNAQLLGGTISFFQSICVLGYSMFPLVLAALVIGIVKLVLRTWLILDSMVVGVGYLWALRVSSLFMSTYVPPERRVLALYPVFFFYTFLGWMIVLF